MATRRKAGADEAQGEDWTRREPEAEDHTGQEAHDTTEENAEDQDEGENAPVPGEAEDEDAAADFAAMSNVDHDAHDDTSAADFAAAMRRDGGSSGGTADGIALGAPDQGARVAAGIDSANRAEHVQQAQDRTGLNNGQTDHEAANALDPISGTANPGVTDTVRHSTPGRMGASDMSGRPALPDPFADLDQQSRGVMTKLRKASDEAHHRDRANGHGWLDLRQLGVNKAVMDSLVESGAVEQSTRPGGTFSPETGTVYRISDHHDD